MLDAHCGVAAPPAQDPNAIYQIEKKLAIIPQATFRDSSQCNSNFSKF
jgi:hypothetical protein